MSVKSQKYKLKKINAPTLTDEVEQRLLDYLLKNGYKPGNAIPGELELAENLGVSRSIVREALSRFRMLGLIESKKRRGMTMSYPDLFSGIERLMNPQILNDETAKDIFEFRLVLEMGLADLIFARKTKKDISDLEKILEKEVSAPKRAIAKKCEVEFHSRLYQMTGNNTLMRFHSLLWPVFIYIEELETKMGEKPALSRVSHQHILDHLKNGTPESYQNAMREHLHIHFQRIEQKKIE